MNETIILKAIKNIVNEVESEYLTFESNFYKAIDIQNLVDFVTVQGNDVETIMEFSLEEYFEEYEAQAEKEELQSLCNCASSPVNELVEILKLKLCFAFELLRLDELLKVFQNEISVFLNNNILDFIYESNTGEVYSIALKTILKYNDLLKTTLSKDDYLASSFLLNKLEEILKETSTIIELYNLQPHCEAEVRKAVFNTLRLFYPDVAREFPVSNVNKNYYIDMAIKSLNVGIEYKYANSEKEVRNFLDEIYTDVHGYSESSDLKNFIAVLYMTGAYTTEGAIQAAFKMKKINNWKIIICKGHGDRNTD